MREWYCVIGGNKYGPVLEDILRTWIAEGRVTPQDLVWSAGMPEWVQAGRVPGLFAATAPEPTESLTKIAPPPGTSGSTPNRDLMTQARQALTGHWGLAIGFLLLYMLLAGVTQIIPVVVQVFGLILRSRGLELAGDISGQIISLIITGPFVVGMVVFFLTISRRAQGRLDSLFDGFRVFGRALGIYLLVILLVLSWTVLFALPGIAIGVAVGYATNAKLGIAAGFLLGGIPGIVAAVIAGLRYAMGNFILADHPRLGPLECIRASERIMNGKKWKLFCLGLRFIGWGLLCILTCGIGFLWMVPYSQVSMARFYDDLRPSAAAVVQPAVQGPAPTEPAPTTA